MIPNVVHTGAMTRYEFEIGQTPYNIVPKIIIAYNNRVSIMRILDDFRLLEHSPKRVDPHFTPSVFETL